MTTRTVLVGLYAIGAYAIGMASLLYLMGFVWGAPLPKTVDGGLSAALPGALAADIVLLAAFLVPHSLMARPRFKAAWTRLIPPVLERATYILVSGVSLLALMWAWQPMPRAVWQVDSGPLRVAVHAIYAVGWVTILLATLNIDHLRFFGLRQAWDAIRGRQPRRAAFTATWLYGIVRHPISLGWLIVFWATPQMTEGHLLLAAGMSIYIAIVTPIEENDLVGELGEDYRAYRTRVRAFIPWRRAAVPDHAHSAPAPAATPEEGS